MQDEKLSELVSEQKAEDLDWRKISEHFFARNAGQCQNRWDNHLDPDIVKGPWTKEVTIIFLRLVVMSSKLNFFVILWLTRLTLQHFLFCHMAGR